MLFRSALMEHRQDKILRLTGLSHLLLEDTEEMLRDLKKVLPKQTEFCASNEVGCGTAVVTEWLSSKCGNTVVTSFGGIGGYAPFEEVLLATRHLFRRHPQTNYEALPQLKALMSAITKVDYATCAPVIGEGIFTVESGIHIGGILKHPKCYELYPPETVGSKRTFVYGKFSGKAAIRHKLQALQLDVSEYELVVLTHKIKEHAEAIGHPVSDATFRTIVEALQGKGACDERKEKTY